MGSAFAASVANLFMSSLEVNFILNPSTNPFFQHIFKFFCFIDDCFCVYTDPASFPDFVAWLNNIHPTISFTLESSTTSINFLDTTVYLTDRSTLAIRPFIKKTDMNTYLHFRSFHPHHLRSNIPYGQFLRVKRNSTSEWDYKTHSQQLCKQFLVRQYPSTVIQNAFQHQGSVHTF